MFMLKLDDWLGLIEIKLPVHGDRRDFFTGGAREAWILLTFDILVAAVASPQGTTQMTPPRHRPGQKPGKRAHAHSLCVWMNCFDTRTC